MGVGLRNFWTQQARTICAAKEAPRRKYTSAGSASLAAWPWPWPWPFGSKREGKNVVSVDTITVSLRIRQRRRDGGECYHRQSVSDWEVWADATTAIVEVFLD